MLTDMTKVMGTLRKLTPTHRTTFSVLAQSCFFLMGFPRTPATALAVFPPAMLCFRCACIFCLISETEKENDIFTRLLYQCQLPRYEGRTGVCTDGCFAPPESRVPAIQTKKNTRYEQHHAAEVPSGNDSHLLVSSKDLTFAARHMFIHSSWLWKV
jgi:hypothetical protein